MHRTIAIAVFTLLLGNSHLCFAQFAKSTTSSRTPLHNINRVPQKTTVSPLVDGSLMQIDHGGTFLDVRLKTKPWIVPRLVVSTTPLVPKNNLSLHNPQDVQQEKIGKPYSSQPMTSRLTALDLKADTDYHYVIFFSQFGAPFKPMLGQFRTRKRHVSIQVTRLFIADDSDDLSCGDLAFTYQLFNGSQDHRENGTSLDYQNQPGGGYLSLDSGDFFHPGALLVGNDVEENIKVAISVLDDDTMQTPFTLHRVGGGHYPDEFLGTGCDDDYEWNSVVATIELGHKTYITPPSASTQPTPSNWLHHYETKSKDLILHIAENDHTCLEIFCEVTYLMWYE